MSKPKPKKPMNKILTAITLLAFAALTCPAQDQHFPPVPQSKPPVLKLAPAKAAPKKAGDSPYQPGLQADAFFATSTADFDDYRHGVGVGLAYFITETFGIGGEAISLKQGE